MASVSASSSLSRSKSRRTSVTKPSDLTEFIGTESTPGTYRIAQVLLAIVCGYPNSASLFLQQLLKRSTSSNSWKDFIADCSKMRARETDEGKVRAAGRGEKRGGADGREAKARVKEKKASDSGFAAVEVESPTREDLGQEWQELCEALGGLDEGFIPQDLSRYFDLALRAARFSFSVSELPA